jgi:hypothetical protein
MAITFSQCNYIVCHLKDAFNRLIKQAEVVQWNFFSIPLLFLVHTAKILIFCLDPWIMIITYCQSPIVLFIQSPGFVDRKVMYIKLIK